MEEVKQTRVHLDIAKRIVDKLTDGESYISQNAALQVLKPLMRDHIAPAILEENRMPEDWFIDERTSKDKLLNELSSYLQRINFIETMNFNYKL